MERPGEPPFFSKPRDFAFPEFQKLLSWPNCCRSHPHLSWAAGKASNPRPGEQAGWVPGVPAPAGSLPRAPWARCLSSGQVPPAQRRPFWGLRHPELRTIPAPRPGSTGTGVQAPARQEFPGNFRGGAQGAVLVTSAPVPLWVLPQGPTPSALAANLVRLLCRAIPAPRP